MPAYFASSCGSITALLVQFCCDKLFVDMWTCCTLSIPSMFSCLSPPFVWFSWWSQIVLNSLCKSLCLYVGPGSGFWFLGFLCFRASFLYLHFQAIFYFVFGINGSLQQACNKSCIWVMPPRMWIWTGEPKVISEHGLHSGYWANAAGFELHMFPP